VLELTEALCPNCRKPVYPLKYEYKESDLAWGGLRVLRSSLSYCPPCDRVIAKDLISEADLMHLKLPRWLSEILSEIGMTDAQKQRLLEMLLERVQKTSDSR